MSCWLDAPEGIDRVFENMTASMLKTQKCECERVLKKRSNMPCLSLFMKGLKGLVEEEEEEEEGDIITDGMLPSKKRKIKKASTKKRDRRKRSGYKRSRNRKSCVYGGNSNDIGVYID